MAKLRARLSGVSETAALDAQVLLGEILGRPRAWLLAHPEAEVSPEQEQALERAAIRLQAGEPLPYVLGHWEFFGLQFSLTPEVLIPRPETELLVETALDWLRAHPGRRLAADVGTGSGCIAVSLAVQIPDLQIIALDLSWPALQTASLNAARNGVPGRVHFLLSDLLRPFAASHPTHRFDLICANLPYIPGADLRSLSVYGREPTLALDGGPDGLSAIGRLLQDAPARLATGGLVLLEIESSQGRAAATLARSAFPAAQVQVLPDLAGRDRLVRIQQPPV